MTYWWRLLALCTTGWLLLWLPQVARAVACSPYMGQVVINEVRVGKSNATDAANQIELFNSGGVAAAVWKTWSVQVWLKDGTKAAVTKGTYPMGSGHTANGQFVYNNTTKYWLQNRDAKAVDIGLYDASGNLVAYFAIEGAAQTVPACYGATTTVQSSGGGDETGRIMRPVDGTGAWPSSLTKTSVHTIGRTNACSASGDLVVGTEVDWAKPVQNRTTVTYTVTVFNNACSTNVSGVKLLVTNLSTGNFASLTTSASAGTVSASGSDQSWNVGTVNAGVMRTLTVTGVPKNLGTLSTVSSVTAPTSGLINTADDSDGVAITVYPYDYVGFAVATDTATEGTDATRSAVINLNVPASQPVTVNYSVSGTAGAGDTNLGTAGSIVIVAGDTSGTIDFGISNDAIHEATETLVLTITSVTSSDTSVRIGTAGSGDILSHTITLYDDDPGPDHYELSLPTSSLTCLPTTVKVTACADATSPCTNPITTLAGWTVTLSTSGGALGSSTVALDASGIATTTLSHPSANHGAAVSVTLAGQQAEGAYAHRCCPDGVNCAAASSCSTTFSTAALIIASAANGSAATLPTQTAGTASGTYYLRAVKTNTTTKACEPALSGATTVNWAYQCINPTNCSANNLLSIDGGSATTVQRNNSTGVSGYTAVPMSFDANGNAPFSFNFRDVGQVTLWANKSVNSAVLAGSSNAFVSRPAGFTLSAIVQTASPHLANPAATSAGGAKFVKAGEHFSATVTATTSTGAAAPNYGKEASPDGVLLTRTLVLPAGGAAGTLANATITGGNFGNGVATVGNLAWDEVGIITLTPSVASGNYLGTGNVTGTPSGNVGRFVPDHFTIAAGTPVPACSGSFTYFGQDGLSTPFTLYARNAADVTTQNYAGGFAKLGLTSWSGLVFSSTGLPAGAALGASATPPSGTWVAGTADITVRHQISRPTSPVGEASVVVLSSPVDADGVTMAATPLGVSTALRYGRLRLNNAFGSARSPLQLPVSADYWRGSGWVLNSADSCTALAASSVALSNPRDAKGNVSTASSQASAVSLSTGQGLLVLAAPAPVGSSVSFDLALNLGATAADQSCQASHPVTTGAALSWLRSRNGNCSVAFDRDPGARATFGIFSPESRKVVHVREIF